MEKLFIFDFDGVIAFLFEKHDLNTARREMLDMLLSFGIDASGHDNMFTVSEVIEASSLDEDDRRKALLEVDRILKTLEMESIEDADPVPGLEEVFPKVIESGIHVAVASNNNPDAVRLYLDRMFPGLDILVEGRDALHQDRLKPSPYMLQKAMEHHGIGRENTIFFGDAVSDMEAAENAGVGFYGFIPSEKKRIRMEKVLPRDRLLSDWHELEDVLLSRALR